MGLVSGCSSSFIMGLLQLSPWHRALQMGPCELVRFSISSEKALAVWAACMYRAVGLSLDPLINLQCLCLDSLFLETLLWKEGIF